MAQVDSSSPLSASTLTDLGYVPRRVIDELGGVNFLVAEHNHDERMLVEGQYPASLKRRISSPLGHLSNDQGAELVANVSHPGLERVLLAHLSETNNTPDAALRTFEKLNRDAPGPLKVEVARQDRPCGPYEVLPHVPMRQWVLATPASRCSRSSATR